MENKENYEGFCIDDEEVKRIISLMIEVNDNYDEVLILSAIKGCCSMLKIVKHNDSFLECVKERTKQIYLTKYKL